MKVKMHRKSAWWSIADDYYLKIIIQGSHGEITDVQKAVRKAVSDLIPKGELWDTQIIDFEDKKRKDNP